MNQNALFNITYGLYLLVVRAGERDNACVINTAVQVAEQPVRIAVSVSRKNLTHDILMQTGVFNLCPLSEEAPFALFRQFGMQSGREADKFAQAQDFVRSENGLYYAKRYANAFLSARVVERMDLGTHTLFVAEVTDGDVLSQQAGCTYGYYQRHIKPKPAAEAKKGWVCTVCGYVHEGETLPEDFICPLCKHGKEVMIPLGVPSASAAEQPQAASGVTRWVCTVCGYVHEGDAPPEICPLCKVPAEKFERMDSAGQQR